MLIVRAATRDGRVAGFTDVVAPAVVVVEEEEALGSVGAVVAVVIGLVLWSHCAAVLFGESADADITISFFPSESIVLVILSNVWVNEQSNRYLFFFSDCLFQKKEGRTSEVESEALRR